MNNPLSPRARMLAAYTGAPTDFVPVAPEFWYYLPARVLGISMIELELEVPHWQALQATFRRYQCEGWGIVAPSVTASAGKTTLTQKWLGDGRLEETSHLAVAGQVLRSRRILDPREPSWGVEHYVKDFAQDWPAYARVAFAPLEEYDWSPVQRALDAVGEDYLLEVFLGTAFIDFAGGQREGSFAQVIEDLQDRPLEMRALQQRYIEYMVEKTCAAFRNTTARSIFIGSIWSSMSLLSPRLWRTWDKPVLDAIIQAAHSCGGMVHHHFHGRCLKVLPDLAGMGLDCICPFERLPGGDISDLLPVARLLDGRTTFNGNVQTVETLIRGKPADVRREVEEIFAAFEGSTRLIIGTGDQVGAETPEENIVEMISAARELGRR